MVIFINSILCTKHILRHHIVLSRCLLYGVCEDKDMRCGCVCIKQGRLMTARPFTEILFYANDDANSVLNHSHFRAVQ